MATDQRRDPQDPAYAVRAATLDDIDVLTHHRIGMFSDMGVPIDRDVMAAAFRSWLADALPADVYRAWLVETGEGVIAGGGITIIPWPPGPSLNGRVAFVYNVYTEAPHRHRGVGRLVMETIHAWCRANGIDCVWLNASAFGQPLYASMGYQVVASPMMRIKLPPGD